MESKSAHMTWEQKMLALSSIIPESRGVTLWLKELGVWHASATGACVGNGATIGTRFGTGATPAEAVESLWKEFAEISDSEFVVINETDTRRRRNLRWNGFMWADDFVDNGVGEERISPFRCEPCAWVEPDPVFDFLIDYNVNL